jgi:hypothetical protein
MKNRNHAGKAAREVVSRHEDDVTRKRDKTKAVNEDAPTREKMKPRYSWKHTSTRLWGVMSNFLDSRVGRRWDNVYSEINARFTTEIRKQGHSSNKEFLSNYVEENIIINDEGEIFDSRGMRIDRGFWVQFYVDKEGILQKVSKIRTNYSKPKHGANLKTIDGTDYFFHNDLWWRIKLRKLPERKSLGRGSYGGFQEDVFFGPIYRQSDYFFVDKYGKPCYAEWKQQANSKEIKKLK